MRAENSETDSAQSGEMNAAAAMSPAADDVACNTGSPDCAHV